MSQKTRIPQHHNIHKKEVYQKIFPKLQRSRKYKEKLVLYRVRVIADLDIKEKN